MYIPCMFPSMIGPRCAPKTPDTSIILNDCVENSRYVDSVLTPLVNKFELEKAVDLFT